MSRPLWTQRSHFGPSPRMGHALAYDAARRRVVLFAGLAASGSVGDTWVWDGTLWTQVAETGPAARRGHTLAYDSARQEVVLFGGQSEAGLASDTWVWDGSTWTQVAEIGPPARTGHAMAYDERRFRLTLFGGLANEPLDDTWEWDGTAWTQQGESGPAARHGHVMAFNFARSTIVLFGGAYAELFDDTWEWSGTVWTQAADFGGPATINSAMTEDGRAVTRFGGAGSTGAAPGLDTTWDWRGTRWTERQPFGPPGRLFHAMAFDRARARVVLFGGTRENLESGDLSETTLLGDTWERAVEGVLATVNVSPESALPGATVAVTVQLNGPADTARNVQLTVTRPDGSPSEVPVPAVMIGVGQDRVAASINLPLVYAPGAWTIAATVDGVTRTTTLTMREPSLPRWIRIIAVQPNPAGEADEAVHLRTDQPSPVILIGWRITNAGGVDIWTLDGSDGAVFPQATTVVVRRNRPMQMPNNGGSVVLIEPGGNISDVKTYGAAALGELISFEE